MSWPFGDILRTTQSIVDKNQPALMHGNAVRSWGDLTRRSDSLAGAFAAARVAPGDKVAHYMRNSPAYLETSSACFVSGLIHVNVNYRYTENELYYILDNSDAAVIVYAQEFAPQIASLQPRLTRAKLFVEISDGPVVNAFAESYEALAEAGYAAPAGRIGQDDQLFIYTGGTTGLPKGVMWRQADIWAALGSGAPAPGMPPPQSLAELGGFIANGAGGIPTMICPPLMHGAGYLIAVHQMLRGGAIITVPGTNFEAETALDIIASQKPKLISIVGDAFGRPMMKALDANPGRYDLSSVMMMVSSGAMWSPDVKAGLGRHLPAAMMLDALGSSEVLGMGMSAAPGAASGAATRFKADDRTKVVTDDGREVVPGSGEIGRIFRGGPIPLGYYKDPEKSARAFTEYNGARYAVPGDYATIEQDGSITLIGRGSQVINTGGEKVFVEEVEEALKTHPAVDDALVFGVADEKWGQAVTAVVEAHTPVSPEELVTHLRATLAPYKSPKRIIFTQKVPRGPNGKANYEAARALAAAAT
ncbi:MAG: AMP-binding protein [Caulobacterales bacterium]